MGGMSDEPKVLEQVLEKLRETIKGDKVAHVIELRELNRTIEEERATHTREISVLDSQKSAEIAILAANNRMLEETNDLMSKQTESLRMKIKEYEVALQSSPTETISFQQRKIEGLEEQNKELQQQHKEVLAQLIDLHVTQQMAEMKMAENEGMSQAEAKVRG